MENSYYSNTHYHNTTYNPLWTTPSAHIHPDSAAAQLGLTPDALTTILQDQQREYQWHELEYEAAQPPHRFADTIHADSAVNGWSQQSKTSLRTKGKDAFCPRGYRV